MGESKISIVAHISDMRMTMTEFLEYIDMSESLKVVNGSSHLTVKILRDAEKWMHKVHSEYLKTIQPIWKLLPPNIWQRYKTWNGFDEHREVEMLKKVVPAFKKLLKDGKRPDYFKKGSYDERIEKAIAKELRQNTVQPRGTESTN